MKAAQGSSTTGNNLEDPGRRTALLGGAAGAISAAGIIGSAQASDGSGAQTVLKEDGTLVNQEENEEEKQWNGYLDRTFAQLEWWGDATRRHKKIADPFETSPSFQSSPSQRNAPS